MLDDAAMADHVVREGGNGPRGRQATQRSDRRAALRAIDVAQQARHANLPFDAEQRRQIR